MDHSLTFTTRSCLMTSETLEQSQKMDLSLEEAFLLFNALGTITRKSMPPAIAQQVQTAPSLPPQPEAAPQATLAKEVIPPKAKELALPSSPSVSSSTCKAEYRAALQDPSVLQALFELRKKAQASRPTQRARVSSEAFRPAQTPQVEVNLKSREAQIKTRLSSAPSSTQPIFRSR